MISSLYIIIYYIYLYYYSNVYSSSHIALLFYYIIFIVLLVLELLLFIIFYIYILNIYFLSIFYIKIGKGEFYFMKEEDELALIEMSEKKMRKEMKKTLIYLYEHLDRSNTRVIDEFAKNELKVTRTIVNKWFKDEKIKIGDYLTMYDKDFKREVKKVEERFKDETIIIFHRDQIKSVELKN